MRRAFQTFLGVDLGGGKGRTTAVARLELAGRERPQVMEVGTSRGDREPFYDEVLVEHLGAHAERAVLAIDAPLTLTACIRCTVPICPGIPDCADRTVVWFRTAGRAAIPSGPTRGARGKPSTTPYTQRATEVMLERRHGIVPREALGQGTGPLTARAAHLVRALARHGYVQHENLIEVFPRATLHKLCGDRIARRYKGQVDTWRTRAIVLESLRDSFEFGAESRLARETCLGNDHCFDALISAYTAYLWAREGWTLPETHREVFAADGWIYAPGLDDDQKTPPA